MARKLSPKDLEAFRALLLHVRAEITGDISRLEQDAFGIDGEKAGLDVTADSGSDAYYQDFNLELLELDGSTLGEVDAALKRIADGAFGNCEECEDIIPKARLRAIPYARLCIGCKRELEQAG